MQRSSTSQTHPVTYDEMGLISLLRDCVRRKDLHTGSRIHADILKNGILRQSPYLGSTLVNMYAKCGDLAKAKQVLEEEIPLKNVVSWSALISGYVQYGKSDDAFSCFAKMEKQGITPDVVTFTSILKACGITKSLEIGEKIHNEIANRGFLRKDVVLGTALVDMYARCGELVRAREVFNELPFRDVVSYSAIIAGYAQHGQVDEALNSFGRMRNEVVSPNAITFTCLLKACGSIKLIDKGIHIHNVIYINGLLQRDAMLGNSLVDMYAKCGFLAKAHKVLSELPIRDVVSWSALISAYAQQDMGEEALVCFQRLRNDCICPNEVTFIGILMACGDTRDIEKGKQIHAEIIDNGLLEADVALGNALVDMYARCNALAKAHEVLSRLPIRDVVSWNGLISGYVQMGQCEEALHCFKQMQGEGLFPNEITFTCVLKACGISGAVSEGKQMHDLIINKGLMEKDLVLGTALVDMYAKCGLLENAQKVLKEMHVQDVVCWNALISGYVQTGQGEEAMECYRKMECKGYTPSAITFTCILKACGMTGAFDKGEEIHKEIINKGMLRDDIVLRTALVDMYARCGALPKAQQVLEELCVMNVVSWNALISGFAQQGRGEEAVECFKRMLCKGLCPNSVTFLSVLNACSHSGLVEQGQLYYEDMSKKYRITPDLGHYSCMIDLFGRAGHFDKAMEVIKEMPSSDYPPVWGALLGACQKWGNVELGRFAFDQALQLDASNDAAYACMTNIYAAAGMQEDVGKIEAMRMKNILLARGIYSIYDDTGT